MAKRAVGKVDVFVNRALQTVTQSGVNALTFAQMRFGMGIFTGTALIINAIDWLLVVPAEMLTASDFISVALTNRDDLSALMPDNMNVLAMDRWGIIHHGTPASASFISVRRRIDFSGFPGGGLIIPANPLFLGVDTTDFAAAATVYFVVYYLTKELADADFIELVQSLIPVNI